MKVGLKLDRVLSQAYSVLPAFIVHATGQLKKDHSLELVFFN